MNNDPQHILKLTLFLLGQIHISGREDVQRLHACFTQLEQLQAMLAQPPDAAQKG